MLEWCEKYACNFIGDGMCKECHEIKLSDMPKLDSSIINSISIQSLAKVKIYSTYDFIQTVDDKIISNSNLDGERVLALKHKLITDYSAKPISGYDCYMAIKYATPFVTHISGLDKLLDGGIRKSSILELCGLVGSGKTQICLSIAVTAALNKTKVEYIDTKLDYSASRCNSLLPENLNDKEMDEVLENINVSTPKDIYELISVINSLQCRFCESQELQRVIIIDSLTASYLPFVGIAKNKGISLLNHIASTLKRLASMYNLVVIITNLGVKQFEMEEKQQMNNCDDIKPLLGKYWLHVPNTRIVISRESSFSSKRMLTIQKSDYLQIKKTEEISISGNGIT